VTEDMENAGLLRALGRVEPPVPDALDAAREVLWAAMAGEMLGAGPAGDAGRTGAAGTDRSREGIRRRRTEPGS
jgi:hypothetical protein